VTGFKLLARLASDRNMQFFTTSGNQNTVSSIELGCVERARDPGQE
jgi:hypothetical protein